MENSSKKKSAAAKTAKRPLVDVSVSNHTDIRIPRVPFLALARDIFRPPYTLSIAAVPGKRAKVLNATYRNKSYSPNVLSFALSPEEGEIILNLAEARKQFEGGRVEGTWTSWIALLVIHSMLHLNGMRHGRTMEERLRKILARHSIAVSLSPATNTHGTTHHHRH